MVVSFDFNLEAWLRDVQIEGKSVEDCKDKLYKMSIEDMLDACYVEDSTVTNITYDVQEMNVDVRVYEIEYETDEDEDLPTEMNLTIDSVEDFAYLDDRIIDMISDETGFTPVDFRFDVIKEY